MFWDGTGAATDYEASRRGRGRLSRRYMARSETGAPHHGVAVAVGRLHHREPSAPEARAYPDVLASLGPDGAETAPRDCLNLHGEGRRVDVASTARIGVAIFDYYRARRLRAGYALTQRRPAAEA